MAKSVKALITPEVLKWARERRIRLPIEYAAEKLKVESEQLEAWEDGAEKPTFAQLKKIAKIYKTHLSIFYLPEPPASFGYPIDHRRFSGARTPDEEQAYRLNANVIEAYERRETLLEFYELLEESPPQVTLKLNETDAPGHAAEKIRNFLHPAEKRLQGPNNPYSALKFWKRTVEDRGILVCQTSVNPHLSVGLETMRGFCIAQSPLPVILVNPKDSPYARIFTIMHELVHIGLGKSVIQNTELREDRPPDNPIEVFCNEVAAGVLVPADALSAIVKPYKRTDLIRLSTRLSKHFRVGPEVIMGQLLTLGYIPQQLYEAYKNNQRKRHKDSSAPTRGFTPYHYRLLNAIGEHFARIAFTAYYEEKITLADLSDAFAKCDPKYLFEIENTIFA